MGATDLLGAEGAAAGAREADAAYQAYHATLVETETDPLVIKAKEKVWIDNQNKSFQDQRTALADAERAATSYATNGVNAIEKAYDDLAGKVSGVVGSLTSLGDIAIPAGRARTPPTKTPGAWPPSPTKALPANPGWRISKTKCRNCTPK